MSGKSQIIWSIKELVEVLRERQLNKFDADIGVSGKRGDGKSTFIDKLLFRFDGFKPWKHQVYSQGDVIRLLSSQKFSYCWDDEAINSGYKRDFQKSGQKELIKIVSAYRSNFNIYISAIPFFYSLDKDLRDLIFMHVHVIERGLAVIFMQLEDQIHSLDPWDTKNNAKLEEKWQRIKHTKPDFKLPYHKLSTFAGYLYFGDLTAKQRRLYEEIRDVKRQAAFQSITENQENREKNFYENVYKLLLERKLSKEGLIQTSLVNGRKYSVVCTQLNIMLTDNGIKETLSHFLAKPGLDPIHSKIKQEINQLVPTF